MSTHGRVRSVVVVGLLVVLAMVVQQLDRSVDRALLPQLREGVDQPGGYSFMVVRADGSPVRWDPCAAIEWELDVASLPHPDVEADVVRIVDGLALDRRLPFFTYAGQTDRSAEASFEGPPGRGAGLPVLVGFGDVQDHDDDPSTIGLGGPILEARDGDWALTSGRVLLDAAAWSELSPLFRRRLVTHELMHVVGLGHTATDGQMMAPGYAHELAEGDLAGLAVLRDGPCA